MLRCRCRLAVPSVVGTDGSVKVRAQVDAAEVPRSQGPVVLTGLGGCGVSLALRG